MRMGQAARTRVKDLCSVRSGYTVRGRIESSRDGLRAIQPADLDTNWPIDVGSLVRVDAPAGRYELQRGDVLFRSRGLRTIASAVPDDLLEPTIAVMPLFVIRPHDDAVDPSYLAWALNQAAAQLHFRQSSQGQTIQMVSKRVLEETPIAIPPRARQQHIAAVAKLSDRQAALERRLLERRSTLLTLRLAEAAHNFTESPNQNRKPQ